ncbi:MAG: serine/threonine-protein kinase [Lentisphaeria bacterium]|nr:serine/threonine-protein kinase [Lentisphaeria bacterium]
MGLDNIKVLRQINRGGLADIFLAQTPKDGQVVIRRLHKDLVWKVKPHLFFLRGTRMRRKVCPHPRIVSPLRSGRDGFCPYEVLEYVPGENLREYIRKKDKRVHDLALDILRQAAEGVARVHAFNLLHLDIKAENVLVNFGETRDDLVVKLTDFDMSRRAKGVACNFRCGTASYMAPEQLTHGTVSFSNDIFAFGVMAYFMVTGRMPFHGWTEKELRKKQASQSFQVLDVKKLNAGLAPKLGWIINRCLEKDVNQRFPSMAYLVQELGRL